MLNENIAAISTAEGVGGVAIIRISGDSPLEVAEKILVPAGKRQVKDFEPYRMYPGRIKCVGFEDFGLCVYFRSPHSFTGEDVVELHCHGGYQIAGGVLRAALDGGARMALNGEFSKRAFLNGKLSLASAEGLIDMINATSLAEVRAGNMLYSEKLTAEVVGLQNELKDIRAGISADIAYPEEDVEATELSDVGDRLNDVDGRICAMIKSYDGGKKIKRGVTVALCGAPNAGKSSLLNALIGYDKAIVSPTAGTTRDAVEGTIEIAGVRYNLYDTAGLRENADEIESAGISMAKKIVASADIIVYVSEGEYEPLEGVAEDDPRLIRVFNKCDINTVCGDKFDISLSAKTDENIDGLKKLMSERAMGANASGSAMITEERHFAALCRADASLRSATGSIGAFPLDIISLDITDAWSALGEITGETANEEIISEVFAKFCVGK